MQKIFSLFRAAIQVFLLFVLLGAPEHLMAQACPYEPVELCLEESRVSLKQGEQYCIDIYVNNFENISQAIMFFIFSPEKLRLDSIDGSMSGLPGFKPDKSLAGLADPFPAIWSSLDATGHTLPDSTILMTMCFTMMAEPGETDEFIITELAEFASASFFREDGDNYDPECTDVPILDSSKTRIVFESIPEQTDFPQIFVVDKCGSVGNNIEGRIGAKIFYGTPPYTVEISGRTPINTNETFLIIDDLSNGTYDIKVTDSAGKSSPTSTFALDDTPTLVIEDKRLRVPTCDIANNGSISIDVNGGKPFSGNEYKFKWVNQFSGRDVKALRNLTSGMYTVIVEDSLGCKAEKTYDLTVDPITIKSQLIRDALCEGRRRGLISLELEGGRDGFDYQGIFKDSDGNELPPFITSTSAIDKSLFPGDYTLSVSKDNIYQEDSECNVEFSFSVGVELVLGVEVIGSSEMGCGNNQLAHTIEINREDTPDDIAYNVELLKNGISVFDTLTNQAVFNTPCLDTGLYIVRLFGAANGCESFDTIFLLPNTIQIENSSITSPQCADDTIGSIALEVTTQFPPLMYSWSSGESGIGVDSVGGLKPGTYYVTISDSTGLSKRDSFKISAGDSLSLLLEIEPISCPGGLGLVRAIGSSSTGNMLSYSWTPDETNQTGSVLPDVPAGTYAVNMVSEKGCSLSDSINLSGPAAPIAEVSNITAPRCVGQNQGTVDIRVLENGDFTSPFFFAASNGQSFEGDSFNITELASGANWVVYSDGVCTFDTVYFTIPEANAFSLDSVAYDPILCYGGTTAVSLRETNGDSVIFRWSDDGTERSVRSDIGAGTYKIELIKDDCIAVDSIIINEPSQLTVRIDSSMSMFAACGGDNDATLIALAEGGTITSGDYVYNWLLNNTVINMTNTLDSVGPNTYTITAKDDNECIAIDTVTVIEPAPVVAAIGSVEDPSCTGQSGTITIASASGGIGGPYLFQVNTSPTLPISDTAQVVPGEFTVRVFDQNGCSWDTMVTVVPAASVDVALGPDQTIEIGRSAEITATVTSSTPIDSLLWSPSDNIECLDAGCFKISVNPPVTTTYTVTVNTVNGCTATDDITINVERTSNVYIPNAINPNSAIDANQIFKVYGGSGVQGINFIRIYDRWGSLVHAENTPQAASQNGVGSWRGIFQGTNTELNPGVYTYHVEISFLDGGPTESRRGTVTLMR